MSFNETNFTACEIEEAKQAFSAWQSKAAETIDEYTLRKRKAELYALVRTVIKNELDESQQELVRLHWYEGRTLIEISKIMNLDKSTLCRKEKKINSIIYEKLKYAMEYRYGKSFDQTAQLVIKSRNPVCCPVDGNSIAERLKNLRLRQSLDAKDIANASGISQSRIELIEKHGGQITAEELTRLCKLYGTTSDYIIFGKGMERRGQ